MKDAFFEWPAKWTLKKAKFSQILIFKKHFFSRFIFTRLKHAMVKKITIIERAQVLGLLKAGLTQQEMALETGRAGSSISQLNTKARELSETNTLKTITEGRGRKKLATPEDVRKIVQECGTMTSPESCAWLWPGACPTGCRPCSPPTGSHQVLRGPGVGQGERGEGGLIVN